MLSKAEETEEILVQFKENWEKVLRIIDLLRGEEYGKG